MESEESFDLFKFIIDVLAHERAIQTYLDDNRGIANIGIYYIYRFRCSEALRLSLTLDLDKKEELYRRAYTTSYERLLRHIFARGIRAYLAEQPSEETLPYLVTEVGKVIEADTGKTIELPTLSGGKRSYKVMLTARIDLYAPNEKEVILIKPFEKPEKMELRARDLNEVAVIDWIARRSGLDVERYRLLYISFNGQAIEYVVENVIPNDELIKRILEKLVEYKLFYACNEETRGICNKCLFRDYCIFYVSNNQDLERRVSKT